MKLKHLMTGAAMSALIAGGAIAQDTSTDMATDPPAATDGMATDGMGDAAVDAAPVFTSIEEMTVGDVLGMVAYDPEGNRIAEIDYVIEGDTGPSAVLGIGGFIGLGEYTVALPLSDFELGEDGNSFVLSTDKETLKAQPEIDESGLESLPAETPIAELMPAEDEGDAAMDEESTEEAPGDETTMEEEPMEEEAPVEEETVEEAPVEDETMTDETVEEDPADTETDMETETEAETDTEEETTTD